ncbi:MAG: response regulator [Pseudomonadales bacterium]
MDAATAVKREQDQVDPGQQRLGRSGWRLGSQITAMVAGSLLVTVIATAIGSSLLISSALSNDFMRSGKNIASVLAEQVKLYVLIGSPEGARRAVEVVRLFPGMESAVVYEFDGSVLSAFGADKNPEAFDSARHLGLEQTRLARETHQFWEFIAPVFADSAEPTLVDQEAVQEQKSLIGWVRIRISKDQLYAARDKIIAGNIAVITFFSLLLVFALRRLGNFLTRPLEDFVETMRASAEGQDHSQRVNLSGSRETLLLANSFNNMMQVLEERNVELASARDHALDAARLKSEFAANVSHEIRTPLNGIVGTLDLLRRSGLDMQQQEYVALAESASTALVELINDILDFSRLTLDQSTVNSTAFDLHALLEELVALQSRSSDAEHLDVMLSYDKRLPFILESDPNKIRQLLNNFLNNAIKFTDSGTIELRVTRETVAQQKVWIRLAVIDSGIGIDAQEQKKIFLPYAQSDGSTTRKYSGTGLGLAISEKIADLLQGDIGVVSEPGKGSEFFVCIPFTEVARVPAPRPVAAASGPHTLLVCADTEALVANLAGLAELAGFESAVLALPPSATTLQHASREEAGRWIPQPQQGHTTVLYAESRAGSNRALQEALAALAARDMLRLLFVAGCESNGGSLPGPLAGGRNVTRITGPLRLQRLISELAQYIDDKPPVPVPAACKKIGGLPGCRVLLVDDNLINLEIAAAMLRELGCLVTQAHNGEQARQIFSATEFDIVFMDCRMPGMNGFEVTRWIRSRKGVESQIPIVAMTANSEPQDQMHCYESGMNDFLGKPVTLEQLGAVLGKWVLVQQLG